MRSQVHLTEHPRTTTSAKAKWVPTVCGMCYNECSVRVLVKDKTAITIEGLPGAPPNYGKMCAKGKAGIADLYNPQRVTKPLRRTNQQKGLGIDPKWEEISWDEALKIITTKLNEVRNRNPLGFQIWTFDDAGYGSFSPPFEVAVGGKRGTGVPFGPSLFCGNGVHPVCLMMNGSHDHQPDLEYCSYLIQIGSGYGTGTQSHAMGLAQELAEARVKRDLKMVVVDPCRNNSGLRADEWVSILPGTDSAFCLAIANVLVNELGEYDQQFLLKYTNSPYLINTDGHYSRDPVSGKPLVLCKSKGTAIPFDSIDTDDMMLESAMIIGKKTFKTAFLLLKEHLLKYTPEYACEITTVPASTTRRIAREFSEAAGLGSTTIIDGEVLPLRAACVIWYRGVSQHQHGLHNGWAAAMLNMIVGAVDVPGGNCQVCSTGPWGLPKAGDDGLLITTSPFMTWKKSVPLQPVEYDKDNADLTGMFPLATYSQTMSGLTSLDPDKFKRKNQLEVFFQVRSNPMATTADPKQIAEILKRIPFQVSFIQHHEASSQFADIILPDTHYLERFAPLITNPYRHYRHAATPSDDKWIFSTQQPVVEPVGEARHWVEVLWDLAHLAGFAEDYYRSLNAWFMLTPKYRLNPKKKYSFREFADLLMRSYCGDNQGTEYFAKYGWAPASPKREIQHRYPRIFHDGRIPIYLEHWITAGENVRRVVAEQKIQWGDISGYEALVNYRPCWASKEGGDDFPLYLVNYKVGFLNFSHTLRNPQLKELAWATGEIWNVGIHPSVAKKLGINSGNLVEIESANGKKAQTIARVTGNVHPRVISVPGILGKELSLDKSSADDGLHFNSFIPYRLEQVDMLSSALDACVKVRIKKIK